MKLMLHLALVLLFASPVAFVPAALQAQDIRGFELDRYEYFSQCTTNRAPLDTARAHYLSAFVVGNYGGAVLSGTLTYGGTSWPLTNTGSELHTSAKLPKTASSGVYTFIVNTAAEGVRGRTVSLPKPASGIAPARIANFTEAQSVEAAQDFTVQWDPIRGTGKRDFLKLRIYDSAGQVVLENQLAKGDTSFTIPAGTFAPGTTNSVYLSIVHVAVRVPPRPGHPAYVSVEVRTTRFSVKTLHPEGQLYFGSHQSFAHETDGLINIPVRRTGGAGTVTIDYFTENGTARAGQNFVATNGTLTFPPGVTSQFITVPLLDDGQPTGPLVARVRLTNATGGLLLPARPWLDWGLLDTHAAPGPSVKTIVLSKVSFFSQTNDSLGDQSSRCVTSRFFTSVHPWFPGALTNAILHLPRKTVRNVNSFYLSYLDHSEDFPTRAQMDRQFPAGPYTVEVNTLTQGHLTESLRMTPEPRFPVPHLTNWSAAQSIDASAPFTLRWEPFPLATTNDFVSVSVRDDANVFLVVMPEGFEPDSLPGTATSYELAANTLHPGERYFVDIIFGKATRCETDAATGVKNCTVFVHTTSFYVHTLPEAEALPKRSGQGPRGAGSDCCDADVFGSIPERPLLETIAGRVPAR